MFMKKLFINNREGFTLVELLIVISLIGILASVSLSILNPKKQRNVAEDGVRQSNLEKYALGIEAYANANGKYPDATAMTADASGIPNDAEVHIFIQKFPTNEPTSPLAYPYAVLNDGSSFSLYVMKASDANSCFRYLSIWGKIKVCPIANCTGLSDDAACN
jgi:prepilin-type N-terminal cleavage/methylation domain-containing protein